MDRAPEFDQKSSKRGAVNVVEHRRNSSDPRGIGPWYLGIAMTRATALGLSLALAIACASAPPSSPPSPRIESPPPAPSASSVADLSAETPNDASSTANEPVAVGADAAADAVSDTAPSPPRAPAAACAVVSVGLDLRALPRNASTDQIDLFVRGEGWDVANGAPQGATPRVYTMSGVGVFDVAFDGSSKSDALSRCQRAVRAYLPNAPKKAGSTETAASVTTPCHACPPEAR